MNKKEVTEFINTYLAGSMGTLAQFQSNTPDLYDLWKQTMTLIDKEYGSGSLNIEEELKKNTSFALANTPTQPTTNVIASQPSFVSPTYDYEFYKNRFQGDKLVGLLPPNIFPLFAEWAFGQKSAKSTESYDMFFWQTNWLKSTAFNSEFKVALTGYDLSSSKQGYTFWQNVLYTYWLQFYSAPTFWYYPQVYWAIYDGTVGRLPKIMQDFLFDKAKKSNGLPQIDEETDLTALEKYYDGEALVLVQGCFSKASVTEFSYVEDLKRVFQYDSFNNYLKENKKDEIFNKGLNAKQIIKIDNFSPLQTYAKYQKVLTGLKGANIKIDNVPKFIETAFKNDIVGETLVTIFNEVLFNTYNRGQVTWLDWKEWKKKNYPELYEGDWFWDKIYAGDLKHLWIDPDYWKYRKAYKDIFEKLKAEGKPLVLLQLPQQISNSLLRYVRKDYSIANDDIISAVDWRGTPQGTDYWNEILVKGNYDYYYQRDEFWEVIDYSIAEWKLKKALGVQTGSTIAQALGNVSNQTTMPDSTPSASTTEATRTTITPTSKQKPSPTAPSNSTASNLELKIKTKEKGEVTLDVGDPLFPNLIIYGSPNRKGLNTVRIADIEGTEVTFGTFTDWLPNWQSLKSFRPSPTEKAGGQPEGNVAIGNDGYAYVTKKNAAGVTQWKKLSQSAGEPLELFKRFKDKLEPNSVQLLMDMARYATAVFPVGTSEYEANLSSLKELYSLAEIDAIESGYTEYYFGYIK